MKKRSSELTTQTLLDFDLEESSSDSDFRIEDHDDDSDDYSVNSKDDDRSEGGDDGDSNTDDDSDSNELVRSKYNKASPKQQQQQQQQTTENNCSIAKLLNEAKTKDERAIIKLLSTSICCACLGDRSDDANEIVECDGCGVTVHEGCYGVSDSASVSSTVSSCSTEPWFCEACKAGITDPVCELCPNRGGIFKETDVGKWVHLVCALYVPGVAFGEVDQLSSVTLFEMPYSKWGTKSCSICEDARYSRTGVCIGCDAGMCKTYFHVTCAQSAGLLSEAHSEEVDHADPFYAHCKIHSDKTLIKHRKRNFNALKLRMEQHKLDNEAKKYDKPSSEQQRIDRKLKKHKNKYIANKQLKSEPWVPTQKMSRLLTTSASACRKLVHKADLMGIDSAALEFQEAQMAALSDVRKKWHIPPAFSVEFIGYYLDRFARLKDIKLNLQEQLQMNKKLLDEQQILRNSYDQIMTSNDDLCKMNITLKQTIQKIHADIESLCPTKQLPAIEDIGRPVPAVVNVSVMPPARPISVPTAAALKMGVGFPLNNLPGTKNDTGRILSTQRQNNDDLLHECGICKRCNDQHLLAKCDTCHFYYHLGCLNPPLTRHPKKSKLYGWQCSECDKSDDSDNNVPIPKGPRKSRARYSKDGVIIPDPDSKYFLDKHIGDLINDNNDAAIAAAIAASTDYALETALHESQISTATVTSDPIPQAPSAPTSTILNLKKKQKRSLSNKSNDNYQLNDNTNVISKRQNKNNLYTSSKVIDNDIDDDELNAKPLIQYTSQIISPRKDNNLIKIKSNKKSKKEKRNLLLKNQLTTLINKSNEQKYYIEKNGDDDNDANANNAINSVDAVDGVTDGNNGCGNSDNNGDSNKINNIINSNNTDINNINNDIIIAGTDPDNIKINCNDIMLNSDGSSIINNNNTNNKLKSPSATVTTSGNDNNYVTHQFTSELLLSDTNIINNKLNDDINNYKQNRKRRKDKHKNRDINNEKMYHLTKEHKRKRKHKNYDMENPNITTFTTEDGAPHPRIKIKFKAIPLPTSEIIGLAPPLPPPPPPPPPLQQEQSQSATTATTQQLQYIPTISDDLIIKKQNERKISIIKDPIIQLSRLTAPTPCTDEEQQDLLQQQQDDSVNTIKAMPIKLNSRTSRHSSSTSVSGISVTTPKKLKRDSIMTSSSVASNDIKTIVPPVVLLCDVCQESGTTQNLVQCDDCRKNYHFTCLDPPVKKTPKRRGYSWHCADCDPTDNESN